MAARTVRPPKPPSVLVDDTPKRPTRTNARPFNSMVGAAALLTGPAASRAKLSKAPWQDVAEMMYDEVGEFRCGVNWLANALSRVNLMAAIPPSAPGEEPTPIDADATGGAALVRSWVAGIAGGATGQGQMLATMTRHLQVPGVGYVVANADDTTDSFASWETLGRNELRNTAGGKDTDYEMQDATGEWRPLKATDLLIKVWRPHPFRRSEADSPARACIPVLGEIDLLTKRIKADARSRLTGNGLLILPESVTFPPGQGQGEDSANDVDSFIETLYAVGSTAMEDQSSPAASMALAIKVPDDAVDKVRWLELWSRFHEGLIGTRDNAVKRLALGLDTPPEVLLGVSDLNHWNAWQMAEEAITLHVEPLAELICHALTIGFLHPAMRAAGMDPATAIVWYDTTDLTTRPDRSTGASEAHARRAITDEAYLTELGLDPTLAYLDPTTTEYQRRLVIDIAMANPAQALDLLVGAGIILPSFIGGELPTPAPAPAPAPVAPPADEDVDDPPARAIPDEDQAASAARAAGLLAAADALVTRALEVSGQRLRTKAAKGQAGGVTAIPCPDPTVLHTQLRATDHASLDVLLSGAWSRVPLIAARYGLDAETLVHTLDSYTKGLLATGHAHDLDRLAEPLGVTDARHLATPAAR